MSTEQRVVSLSLMQKMASLLTPESGTLQELLLFGPHFNWSGLEESFDECLAGGLEKWVTEEQEEADPDNYFPDAEARYSALEDFKKVIALEDNCDGETLLIDLAQGEFIAHADVCSHCQVLRQTVGWMTFYDLLSGRLADAQTSSQKIIRQEQNRVQLAVDDLLYTLFRDLGTDNIRFNRLVCYK